MFTAITNFPKEALNELRSKGFEAASEECMGTLLDALNYMRDPNVHFFSIDKKIQSKRKELAELSEEEDKENKYYELIRELIQLMLIKKSRVAAEQVCNIFSHDEWWLLIADKNTSSRKAINKILTEWRKHGRWGRFSTPDLIEIYNRIIPLFLNWTDLAKAELKLNSNCLDNKFAKKYEEFLTSLFGLISQEKALMRSSMIDRVNLGWQMGDMRYDDPVNETLVRLQESKITTPYQLPRISVPCRTMGAEELDAIKQIIENDGTQREKNKIEKIFTSKPVHTQNAFAIIKVVSSNSYTYHVPTHLMRLVITKKPWYFIFPIRDFFPEKKIQYEFLKNNSCQHLLAKQMSYKVDHLVFPNDLLEMTRDSLWEEHHILLKEIKKEEKRSKKASYQILKSPNSDAALLIAKYTQDLKNFRSLILKKHENALREVVTKLIDHYKTPGLSEKKKAEVSQFFYKLNTQFSNDNNFSCCRELIEMGYEYINKEPIKLYTNTDYKNAALLIKRACDQEKVETELAPIVDEVNSQLPKTSNDYSAAQVQYLFQCKIGEKKLRDQLDILFRENPFEMSDEIFTAYMDEFKNTIKIINEIKPDSVDVTVWQQYFYRYVHDLLISLSSVTSSRQYQEKLPRMFALIEFVEAERKNDEVLSFIFESIKKSETMSKSHPLERVLRIYVKPGISALEVTFENSHSLQTHDALADESAIEPGIVSQEPSNVAKFSIFNTDDHHDVDCKEASYTYKP